MDLKVNISSRDSANTSAVIPQNKSLNVTGNALNTSKLKQNTRVRNKDSYIEQYKDKLNYNSNSINVSNTSINTSQFGSAANNKKALNYSSSCNALPPKSTCDYNKVYSNRTKGDEELMIKTSSQLGNHSGLCSSQNNLNELSKIFSSRSLSPTHHHEEILKPNIQDNTEDSVNYASNIIDNELEIENVIKTAPKDSTGFTDFSSETSKEKDKDFIKKIALNPNATSLPDKKSNSSRTIETNNPNKNVQGKRNSYTANSYAANNLARKNSLNANNTPKNSTSTKNIYPNYYSGKKNNETTTPTTTTEKEKEKLLNTVKSKSIKKGNAKSSNNNVNDKSMENSLNSSNVSASKQQTRKSVNLLSNLKSNLLNKMELSFTNNEINAAGNSGDNAEENKSKIPNVSNSANLRNTVNIEINLNNNANNNTNNNTNDNSNSNNNNKNNEPKSKLKLKPPKTKNIQVNENDQIVKTNAEDNLVNKESSNLKSEQRYMKEGNTQEIDDNNNNLLTFNKEESFNSENKPTSAKKIIKVKTVKKKVVESSSNTANVANVVNNAIVCDQPTINKEPEQPSDNNNELNKSIEFEYFNNSNEDNSQKQNNIVNSEPSKEEEDKFNMQYRIETQLSQIDEVLSNCSNFKHPDFYFNKETYNESLKIVSTNHFFSSNQSNQDNDYKSKVQLTENLENSIYIEGVSRAEKSFCVNKTNQISIDSLYPNKLNTSQNNSLRVSRSELAIKTKNQKVNQKDFTCEKLEVSIESKPKRKQFEENLFNIYKKEILIPHQPHTKQFLNESLSKVNQNDVLILPVNNKRKFRENQLMIEKNRIHIRPSSECKSFKNNTLRISKIQINIAADKKAKQNFHVDNFEICINPTKKSKIIPKFKKIENVQNRKFSTTIDFFSSRNSQLGSCSPSMNVSKSSEYSPSELRGSFSNRRISMQNKIIHNSQKKLNNKKMQKSKTIQAEGNKNKLDEFLVGKSKASERSVSKTEFSIISNKKPEKPEKFDKHVNTEKTDNNPNIVDNINNSKTALKKIYSKLEINPLPQNNIIVDSSSNSSSNILSKNKLNKLKENVCQALATDPKEKEKEKSFKQKVEMVKNKLIESKSKSKEKTDTYKLKSLEEFENSFTYRRKEEEKFDFDNFENFVITDEILSEFREKYFSTLEFLDKEMLIKFYKKYMKREYIKNKLYPNDYAAHTLENVKITDKDLKELMRREEVENQKQIKKLKQILEIPEKNSYSANYKPINLTANKSQSNIKGVYEANPERSRKLLISPESLFRIMPINEVDSTANKNSISSIKSNFFR